MAGRKSRKERENPLELEDPTTESARTTGQTKRFLDDSGCHRFLCMLFTSGRRTGQFSAPRQPGDQTPGQTVSLGTSQPASWSVSRSTMMLIMVITQVSLSSERRCYSKRRAVFHRPVLIGGTHRTQRTTIASKLEENSPRRLGDSCGQSCNSLFR